MILFKNYEVEIVAYLYYLKNPPTLHTHPSSKNFAGNSGVWIWKLKYVPPAGKVFF